MKPFVLSAVSGCLYLLAAVPAIAQVIPAADGVGTQVIQTGDLVEITGGQLSGDNANLFHSFEAFGLGADQIADFQVLPNIENVLGRVVGGSGSAIDGVMRVSGGEANLYLIDPAGIVFGENARLDVAGDFVATTATSIGFGDRWLEVMGGNDWASFVGNPSGFGFGGAGAIVNLGELAVEPGRSIGLLGDTVINTGSLSAAGGTVAIVASEAGDRLRLGIPGNVLSLEVDREAIHEGATALVLPELLAGAVESAGSIVRNPDGSVRLSSSPVSVTPQVGDALVSGSIDVSSAAGVGGSALVLGERVGLLAGAIDGSGRDGGGAVNVGGNFQGVGVLPNSELTMVDGGSSIVVDGVVLGDGGRAIVWADGATRFGGEVLARGGAEGGDGGFVEVSGKRFLDFVGFVDTSAVNGEFGTLLLDPTVIRVVDDAVAETNDLTVVDEFGDGDVGGDGETLLAVSIINDALSDVELQANKIISIEADIYLANLGTSLRLVSNGNIFILENISTTGGNIFFNADFDNTNGGYIEIENSNIQTGGGDLLIYGVGDENNYIGVGIYGNSDIEAGGGNINITGIGSQVNGRNTGILIDNNRLNGISAVDKINIVTFGNGTIRVVGESRDPLINGFDTTEIFSTGIALENVSLTTENGLLQISGLSHYLYPPVAGGNSTGVGGRTSSLESLGSGSIVIQGIGGLSGIVLEDSPIQTNMGNILLNATSLVSLDGIQFSGSQRADIISRNGGLINIIQNPCITSRCGAISTFSPGISLGSFGGTEISTHNGNINITNDTTGWRGGGTEIYLQDGSSIKTTGEFGDININADEGNFYIVESSIFSESGNLNVFGNRFTAIRSVVDILDGSILLDAGLLLIQTDLYTYGHNITAGNHNGVEVRGAGYGIRSNGGNIFLTGGWVGGSQLERTRYPGISVEGDINTSSITGDSGDITIRGTGRIIAGNISTQSSRNAGNIDIQAVQSCVLNPAGTCNVESTGSINTTQGIINAAGGINGGNVLIRGSGDVKIGTIIVFNPGFRGDSGSIFLESLERSVDTTFGDLIAASAEGLAGDITLLAENGAISVGDVNSFSFSPSGLGGQIRIDAYSVSSLIEDTIKLEGNLITNNNNIFLNGAVILSDTANINSFEDGSLIINGSIDGAQSLVLNAGTGNIEISGEIGQNTPLRDLTLIGNLIDPSGDPLHIQTQDFIQANSFTTQNDPTLQSGGNITIDDITTPGNIDILSSSGDITARQIYSSNSLGNAGNVNIQGQNVTLASINAQSLNDIGGNIRIEAPTGNVRITDSFTDINGTDASISTAGAIDGGTVYIFHGGGGIIPFVVGNAARNGSAAAITRGLEDENTIAFANYPNLHEQDFEQDTARLTLDTIPAPIPPEPIPPEPTPPAQNNLTPSTNFSSTNEPAQPEIKPDEPELEEPEPLTPKPTNVSTNPPNVTIPSETEGSTSPNGEVSPVSPSETEGSTSPDGEVSPVIPTEPESSEPTNPDTTQNPIDDQQTELDLNDPIVQLALLIGETIGAETTIGTNPDTGNTEVNWSVPDEDGNIFNIEQTIPTLEPETTISEPVTIAAAPPSTPSEPTLTPSNPAPETNPETPIANNPNPSNNNVPIPNEIETADPALDSPTDPTPTQNTDTTDSNTNSTTTFVPTNLDATTFDPLALGTPDEIAETIEADLEAEFENDADDDLNDDGDERLTMAQIKETLQGLEAETGRRGAIVYASTIQQNEDGREHVILALVTPYEATIVRTVSLGDDQTLEELIQDFQTQLLDPRARRFDGYKRPAQKLYDILVRPIEDDLDSLDLDLLIYAVDAGLRHIPLAALHDGDQFLIERYSIGSIPSLGLTDTRYRRLREGRVLAMGADEFPLTNQAALPAVPFELDAIVADHSAETTASESANPDPVGLWPGQMFLNETFTFENLIGQRNTQPYDIVHLATHASFKESDAYITLWDGQRSLDGFREAEWYAPPTVELLVLSACETARGSEEAERGFAGLAVRSGVKSALASLWSVSDIGTLAMMAGFYQALPDMPLKAEAVRVAQLAMLRGEITPEGNAIIVDGRRVPLPPAYHGFSGEFSHPYYWAAFSLVGSPW